MIDPAAGPSVLRATRDAGPQGVGVVLPGGSTGHARLVRAPEDPEQVPQAYLLACEWRMAW